jgi:serine/threonine protein kinase
MLNQYLVLKRIGEGPHAKIKLARDTKTNKLVAIKKFAMYLLKKKTKQVKQPNGTCKLSVMQLSIYQLRRMS